MQTLQPNTLLHGGNYKIIRHISSGGFGNTYEGYDVSLDKKVAIKEFFFKDFCVREGDTTMVTVTATAKKPLVTHLKKKFIDEARAIARMEHDNIVKVQALFEENGTAYYVMDYIEGESLGALLKRRGSLLEQEAVAIIMKVASALDYMHRQNRYHLDVKPSNIMLRNDGKVVLIDFGSSKQYAEVDGENTTTIAPCYTMGYAPSEQMNPKAIQFTPATDIYALGATLYKMLTGQTPPSAIDLVNGEEELPPLSTEISDNVRACVVQAMIPMRLKRLQRIDEFLSLIKGQKTVVNKDSEQEDDKSGSLKRKTKSLGKLKMWLLLAGVLGIVVSIIIVVMYSDTGKVTSTNTDNDVDSAKVQTIAFYSNGVLNVNGVTYDMVKVDEGTFKMGATPEMEEPSRAEKPVHSVTLSSYRIGKTEVTQALWQAVVEDNPSCFKGHNRPVEYVSWDDCKRFILKLNSLTGQNFRLPTEAEWEFAARGGNKSQGYQYSGSNNLDDIAWYDDNSASATHDVATKQPNELGIYDMNGNVWEWCQDRCASYSSSPQTNPTGPKKGEERVIRGGDWSYNAIGCRVSCRGKAEPGYIDNRIGFRLALTE